jgi:hypothetical protein
MRLSRFLTFITLITYFSLLYVYQQTEIFRLGYAGQRRQAALEDLLDKNALLRYNISRNASLVRIGERISGLADFQIPDRYRLVRLAPVAPQVAAPNQGGQETLLSRVFGIKSQAEAKTLSSQ